MRKADIITSLCLIGVGCIIIYDSNRLGYGWGMSGPEAGFFPFCLGLGIVFFSLVVLVKGVRKLKKEGPGERLIPEGALKPILWVLVPSTVMVLATEFIGLHLSALLFILFYMRAVGKVGWVKVALVSILVPLSLYVIFDKMFLIPLPQGLWGDKLIPF